MDDDLVEELDVERFLSDIFLCIFFLGSSASSFLSYLSLPLLCDVLLEPVFAAFVLAVLAFIGVFAIRTLCSHLSMLLFQVPVQIVEVIFQGALGSLDAGCKRRKQ